jgi:hypothetical protein
MSKLRRLFKIKNKQNIEEIFKKKEFSFKKIEKENFSQSKKVSFSHSNHLIF